MASGSSGAQEANGESRWSRWGASAFTKSIKVSDWASTYANAASAKIGGERFWPRSDDTEEEIAKCERILRAFTVEGVPSKDTHEEEFSDGKGNKIKKKRKVLRKIPPRAIKNAKGIVIYTAMRSGIAPFGGAGGTGLVLARLPDGSWSAPASVSPNNLSVGLLLGVDVFDVILLLNTDKALESFHSHKVTFGAETAVAAGPVGAGASVESGMDRAPIYSYVRSRGLYAGIEAMGQAFLSRFDENERFYYWPGIQAEDILKGNVRIPPSVYPLHRALRDAESGIAQGGKLERTVYDVVKIPKSEVMSRLSSAGHSPRGDGENGGGDDDDLLQDGEKLKLPPTPAELEALELAGIPDEEDLKLEAKERLEVYKLPAPPMHPKVKTYWDQHPNRRAWRNTRQLVKRSKDVPPEMVPLPPSPWQVPLPDSPEIGQVLELDTERGIQLDVPLLAPPPRRRDGQGAQMVEEKEKAAVGDDNTVLSDRTTLSPPPRRKDGQGAVGSSPAAATTKENITDDAHPHDNAAHDDLLGHNMSEAEADAMIADAKEGGVTPRSVEAPTSADALPSADAVSSADTLHSPLDASPSVQPPTSDTPPTSTESTSSLTQGILPPPPRRPERKR